MKGKIWHRVELLYPHFYMDQVRVGDYVKIVIPAPNWYGSIGRVTGIVESGANEIYKVSLQDGDVPIIYPSGFNFNSYDIELLPRDYKFRTEYELACHELGEDYFA